MSQTNKIYCEDITLLSELAENFRRNNLTEEGPVLSKTRKPDK